MALAVFSADVADTPATAAVREALAAAAGDRQTWHLLSRLWVIRCASNADFRALASAWDSLHREHPTTFDYFALHYDPAGGPVLVAPNPALRTPAPLLAEGVAAKVGRRPGAARRRPVAAAVPLRPARAILDALERFHASNAPPAAEARSRRRRPGTPRGRGGARRGTGSARRR